MRKILLFSVLCGATLFSQGGCGPSDTVDVTFPSGRTVKCEIADTLKKIREGLRYHDSLPPERGMLFVFAQERYNVSFYMPKRMRFNIDMIFLDKDQKVLLIERDLEPCKYESSEDCPAYGPGGQPCKYVVEVVSGFSDVEGLRIGDQLKFELP